MRYINEPNHCERVQLETAEYVLNDCPLHSVERDLKKVSSGFDPKIIGIKMGFGALVKFVDSLPRILC